MSWIVSRWSAGISIKRRSSRQEGARRYGQFASKAGGSPRWHGHLDAELEPTDVSCMAGHANVRTTLLMYAGTTAGVLDRARKATE
jgi:hypothetical protein